MKMLHVHVLWPTCCCSHAVNAQGNSSDICKYDNVLIWALIINIVTIVMLCVQVLFVQYSKDFEM